MTAVLLSMCVLTYGTYDNIRTVCVRYSTVR